MVRRGLVHADNIFEEESHGDHGPSAEADKRPQLARELEDRLTGPDRTGMLRASVSLAVGAASREELERRVARLRREYGTAPKLLRPQGPAAQAVRRPPARPALPRPATTTACCCPRSSGRWCRPRPRTSAPRPAR